jgi:hypothetical protein
MLGPLEMEPIGLFALCLPMAGCAEACHKAGKRCPNLIGRIFLEEMPALDRDLPLVRPSAAELEGAACHDCTRFADD